jgi:hypothetical protein
VRILQLTPYPTINPLHGGQIRSFQIAKELTAACHDVKSIAIYDAENYSDASTDDIPFNSASVYWHADLPWLTDYYTGIFAEKDVDALAQLRLEVDKFEPAVILVEQPWLFRAAQRVSKPGIKLIYSSQNIEWRLKSKILERIGHHKIKILVDKIRALEEAAIRESDLVVACTESDLEYFKYVLGGKPFNGVVAGNGVEPFSCSNQEIIAWLNFFKRPIPSFVSSAHVPNAQGFWDMMAPGLTFLRPDEEILIIGGVSSIIMQVDGFSRFAEVNRSRLNIAGIRDKFELQALIKSSHVLLLPITDGEGSNLKTAEALESGLPIVGTSKAFRGFEEAMLLKHVQIADDPQEFRMAIRRVLNWPRLTELTPLNIRSKFYWKNQLKNFIDVLDCSIF